MTNDVSGFEVLPGGALRTLPGSPYVGGAAGTMPGQVLVSGDGRRLYAVDLFGAEPIPAVTLRSYRIAPDGVLTPDGSTPSEPDCCSRPRHCSSRAADVSGGSVRNLDTPVVSVSLLSKTGHIPFPALAAVTANSREISR
ncbi:hypothetical protein [Nocardia beijingensis]|uniref:hypothetical protein n=1 Tax=Nocardia beijingensis TaxID=95162 RepID=UPI00082CB8CA|nr:hypothetical protein [Nocardia beijingensis]